jgi:hypothetical protein
LVAKNADLVTVADWIAAAGRRCDSAITRNQRERRVHPASIGHRMKARNRRMKWSLLLLTSAAAIDYLVGVAAGAPESSSRGDHW